MCPATGCLLLNHAGHGADLMSKSIVRALKCRECGQEYPIEPTHVCEYCFGPLEVAYDYDKLKGKFTRELIESRPQTMWRYKELLPIDGEPTVGAQNGYTPLVRARNLEKVLGVSELYIKNDSVCYPTLSFKDRVVSVALSKAVEFGFTTVACASTGNLAGSVAANAAAAGLESYVFIPHDLEQGKVLGAGIFGTRIIGIRGKYDDVNRLCSEVAGKYGWAFVNVNVRPFYAEGSKSLGYEVMEQLGWKAPKHIVVPMASGSLCTKIDKSIKEFIKLGLIEDNGTAVYGAQATGCSPISRSVKEGTDLIHPVIADTIAKSLAIGNPADGYYANRVIRESGGWAEDITDEEVVDAMKQLAETEGIFAETAGGVTLGCARKMIESGRLPRDESIVLCITGNGLKTQEAVIDAFAKPRIIDASLKEFDALAQADGVQNS
ncbi:MAG: threonine synthase [Zetaproteobacteria bacterium CG06_land_8_20_14_3_00_59_53]|nr:MAG: threonine synthase [Zetaproteobacteria bacterium CG23_combo_of_CG06-09_8_20_14_all_59_86]PIQ64050.1 MAG: threonine synthase [Zetaproteobacteria bacterium CG11_big_fil_rev_8_21_14_0_20_59_439]PIU69612.1 MAG: threonine synthase [Zetaproteobacteria bacterium CG06_land_8_20_14_3_00_59_53]PIU96267.1 MAG: threonine synthase [Zetaproteobacteria bacterium CG03_land_8_20_14_0_80_59_51]PIY44839.1 MAG: threonine synthase [Zetaproteobacteria bacterium CG_4_10_14_0_8_um_filter_59_127]PJC18935.1 MAG